MKLEPHIKSSLNLLGIVRQETDRIGVAVSFGKDSLVTLDLVCQIFPYVVGYYLFRVRGLSVVEKWTKDVFDRYGVVVHHYPHFDLSRCYRYAVLQPHWKGLDSTPKIKMADIEAVFRKEHNLDWIAYGWKRNDSFSRAMIMKKNRGYDPDARRIFPIRAWTRKQVFSYLKERNLPTPESLGRKDQGGLDFHQGALQMLLEKSPEDYERWLVDFPFSEIQLRNSTA